MKQILLVEDDRALAGGIALALQSEQMAVTVCGALDAAKKQLAGSAFDLLILDVNLPDGSGLTLLQEVKRQGDTPVILLTANDMETDIVTGLERGADDYITKPFSLAVLRARVNTQLRKGMAGSYTQGPFCFHFAKMVFYKNAQPLVLSKTEQKLLRVLVDNKGNTLQRGVLVNQLWPDGAVYVDENALSVTVKRLRDKLEDNPANPAYIKTVYGIGYTWAVR